MVSASKRVNRPHMIDDRSLLSIIPSHPTPDRSPSAIFPCGRLPRDVPHATRTMTALGALLGRYGLRRPTVPECGKTLDVGLAQITTSIAIESRCPCETRLDRLLLRSSIRPHVGQGGDMEPRRRIAIARKNVAAPTRPSPSNRRSRIARSPSLSGRSHDLINPDGIKSALAGSFAMPMGVK